MVRNQLIGFEAKGPSLNEIPAGIASARFVDPRDDTEHALRFAAGSGRNRGRARPRVRMGSPLRWL